MLRASSEASGESVDLKQAINGDGSNSGIEGDSVLNQFAQAALGDDELAIECARHRVSETLGDAAMVDAAAVIANFQRMVRIADGTGIPLDEPVLMTSQSIRSELGIDAFQGAINSKDLPFVKRIMGKVMAPFVPKLLQRMAASRRSG